MPRAVIIGGGISGLSTAYYLTKAGVPSLLVEARPRLGGVIRTEYVDGCVIEAGPDSFISAKPAALELIRELGMAGEVIDSNDHLRKTYVRKNGRLVPLPDGLMLMVPTQIMPMVGTRLLSFPTKIRMGLEWFHRSRGAAPDESVANFVERHYGRETVDYLAEPLLSGIYGGDPGVLSIRSVLPRYMELEAKYGSLTRGVLAERRRAAGKGGSVPLFRTLKAGLQSLTSALESRTDAQFVHGTARALEKRDAGFRVRVDNDWVEADHVVLACEAHRAAPLASGIDARIGEILAGVSYSSSMTVALGFDAREFRPQQEGFGFLIPKKERRRLVACTYVGTKFPHRVPAGMIVLRCFLGGADDAAILDERDETILASLLEELREIVGLRATPRFTRISRWPRSMAQYTVGHSALIVELEQRLPAGLHVAGNAYQGIGIPDCIRMGKAAAERIAAS